MAFSGSQTTASYLHGTTGKPQTFSAKTEAVVTFIPRIMVYCFAVFLSGVMSSQLQL